MDNLLLCNNKKIYTKGKKVYEIILIAINEFSIREQINFLIYIDDKLNNKNY